MALELIRFADQYPVLWHLTSESNLARIQRTRRLESAAELMRIAGDETWLRRRRPNAVPLRIGAETIWLRDQEPLAQGAIELQGGWTFEHFVEEINSRVYFWPGDTRGPIQRAKENFGAFRNERGVVVLRVPTLAVCQVCRPFQLQLTSVNVGAPRVSGGRKSPRGPKTFAAPGAFVGTPSAVREMAVVNDLALAEIWSSVSIDRP